MPVATQQGTGYVVDVDPEGLREAADRVRDLADRLSAERGRLAAVRGTVGTGWQGLAADVVLGEVDQLAHLLQDGPRRLDDAARALTRLAEAADDALATGRRLEAARARARAAFGAEVARADRQQDQGLDALPADLPAPDVASAQLSLRAAAQAARTSAAADLTGELARLDRAWQEELALLRGQARSSASQLGEAVLVRVPAVLVRFSGLTSGVGGLMSSVTSLGVLALVRGALGEGPLTTFTDDLAAARPGDAAQLSQLLDTARALAMDPSQYAAALEAYWLTRAADDAGIDLTAWDTTAGAGANRETIEAVYRYYGDMFLADEDLQWAGMANLIGPSFAAGFFDLDGIRSVMEAVSENASRFPDGVLPPGVAESVAAGSGLSAAEVAYYERTLLGMQKEIFEDMAPWHQAYAEGGIDAVRELAAAGVVDDATVLPAWEDIASGDAQRVAAGNQALLYREQREVINDDYDDMYRRFPTGPLFTYATTFVGAPSIPGAGSYPDVFPFVVPVPTPGPGRLGTPDRIGVPFTPWGVDLPHVGVDNPLQGTVEVVTPFPDGNIASFEDRWALIEQDTLPAYQRLLAQEREHVRDLVGAPVADRVAEYRLQERWPDVVSQLGDWDVRFEQ